MNHKELHERAVETASRFHKAESELINILQQIEEQKVFMKLGYASLFEYSIKALKLSEANTSNFIAVARKSRIVPELKAAIARGEVTVSKARKITPVITKENHEYWLGLAKNLPKPKLEKEVARVMPAAATADRVKYVTENRLEIRFGVSEEVMKKLKRAQDLVSQKTRKAATYEETLSAVLEGYLKREDPVERAKRIGGGEKAVESSKKTAVHKSGGVATDVDAIAPVPGTRYVRAREKHRIHLRDHGRCTYASENGDRCESERWLEVHHVKHLVNGGSNAAENLRTLCSVHHRQMHY